jgi:hypothetical protein
MGHNDCFEAGRFTSIQPWWTASRCSRKWMSGPATPWTQPLTGRQKQIVTATRTAARRSLQEPSVKCKERCFFLDKPLSWMSRELSDCHRERSIFRTDSFAILGVILEHLESRSARARSVRSGNCCGKSRHRAGSVDCLPLIHHRAISIDGLGQKPGAVSRNSYQPL